MLNKTHLLITATNLDRYGRKNDYKAGLEYLKTTIDINEFKDKFVSLKHFFNGDGELFNEMVDYYDSNDFVIYVHEDKWTTKKSIDARRDGSGRFFCGRLADDYARVFTDIDFIDAEYAFIMDDDCPVKVNNGDLESSLASSAKALSLDRCLHSVHYARTFINGRYLTPSEYFERYRSTRYMELRGFINQEDFNFQPRLCKMQDNKIVGKIIHALWKDCFFQKHPETVVGEALNAKYSLYGDDVAFASVHIENAYSLHIGETQENHEFIVNEDPKLQEIYSKL